MLEPYVAQYTQAIRQWTEAAIRAHLLPTELALLERWPSAELASITGIEVREYRDPVRAHEACRTRLAIYRDGQCVAERTFVLRVAER